MVLKQLKLLVIFLSLVTFTQGAFAHSKLNKTSPENGTVMQSAPKTISLYFAKKIRLTRMNLFFQKNDPIKFDLQKHRSFGNKFEFTNPASGVGVYRIEYRGIGEDGHAMRNEFSFEVK
jgi:methionine-rich copper-binding protein CopC